jgi:hypothetical protein
MSIFAAFENLFSSNAQRLIWTRVGDIERALGPPLEPYGGYYSVRVAEMYVKDARVLWRKYLPMVNGVVTQGAIEQASVVGPMQIKQFGDAALDNVVALNQPLSGPIVYTGEEFGLTVGLMAVLSQDLGQVMLDTASSVSSIMLLDLGAAAKLAPVLKSAVEGILGIKDVRLQVGVMDRFYKTGNPLQPGLHVGIAATKNDVKLSDLRYFDGALKIGPDRRSAVDFLGFDFMIVLIESRTNRPDWASLPELAGFDARFTQALREKAHDERVKSLQPIQNDFINAVQGSANLSKPDKDYLPKMMNGELQKRLNQLKAGNFELRGAVGQKKRADDFDFLDLPELSDTKHS